MNRHDNAMREVLLPQLYRNAGDALVLQEWAITDAIVDIGIVADDCIHGYEIKSAADSVTRLKRQVPAYGKAFDRCTLVTAANHVRHALRTLPPWWAIWELDATARCLTIHRAGQQNPDARAVELLWSGELSKLITALGLRKAAVERQRAIDHEWGHHVGCDGRCRRQPTKRAMMDVAPGTPEVRRSVVRALRAREGWRQVDGRSARNYR